MVLSLKKRGLVDLIFEEKYSDDEIKHRLNELSKKTMGVGRTNLYDKTSPGSEVAERTRIRNLYDIRKYVKDEYDFEITISPEDVSYYYSSGQQSITRKRDPFKITDKLIELINSYKHINIPHTDDNMRLYLGMKTMEEFNEWKLTGKVPSYTLDDSYFFSSINRPYLKGRTELLDNICRVFIYLQGVSGRRINEQYNFMYLEGDKIHYMKSKSSVKKGEFVPLISPKQFIKQYDKIKPFILDRFGIGTITKRVNRFFEKELKAGKMEQGGAGITSHKMRMLFSAFCEQLSGNKDKSRNKVIKDCLGHERIENSLYYQNYIIEDADKTSEGKCRLCGSKMTKRHLKTKKHMKALTKRLST